MIVTMEVTEAGSTIASAVEQAVNFWGDLDSVDRHGKEFYLSFNGVKIRIQESAAQMVAEYFTSTNSQVNPPASKKSGAKKPFLFSFYETTGGGGRFFNYALVYALDAVSADKKLRSSYRPNNADLERVTFLTIE